MFCWINVILKNGLYLRSRVTVARVSLVLTKFGICVAPKIKMMIMMIIIYTGLFIVFE
jgi:hypothetical protein